MKELVRKMQKSLGKGDRIRLIVCGKEFSEALVLENGDGLLTIRDTEGRDWVIDPESIAAYASEMSSLNSTPAAEISPETDSGEPEPGVMIREDPADSMLAERVEKAVMPQWFTVGQINKEILWILNGYPAYISRVENIFNDMRTLFDSGKTDPDLMLKISNMVDALEKEGKKDRQSDIGSCCRIIRAMLCYKAGKVKNAVAVLVQENLMKAAASLAAELDDEKYCKAIIGYIIKYILPDTQISEDDRQCVFYYAGRCRTHSDARTFYDAIRSSYNLPDPVAEAMQYLIEKNGAGADIGLNYEDLQTLKIEFSNACGGPFFDEEEDELADALSELQEYSENVDFKKLYAKEKENEPAPEKPAAPADIQYFHAPVKGKMGSSSYSQYWIDFHPMQDNMRQERKETDLYMNPSQIIDPLLTRYFAGLDSIHLASERFEVVFYVGVNQKNASAGGAFLTRNSRKKIMELCRRNKAISAIDKNEVRPLQPIMPVAAEVLKTTYRLSADRYRSVSPSMDQQDSSILTFLNTSLKGKAVISDIPEKLKKNEKFTECLKGMCGSDEERERYWHKLIYCAAQDGDSSLIDLLEGYAIGLPDDSPYHCGFKMLNKIRSGKV